MLIPGVPTNRLQCGRPTIPACSCPCLVSGHSASQGTESNVFVRPGPLTHVLRPRGLGENGRCIFASQLLSCVYIEPECQLV